MSLIRVKHEPYNPFGRRKPVADGRPSGAIPKGARGASTSDHVIPKVLIEVPRDFQSMGVTVGRKLVSCEEAGCLWYLQGWEGEDENAPFRHPVGVECGDFDACPDPNCPCPRNLVYEVDNGVPTGRVGHLVPDYDRGPTWRVNAGRGLYETTISEVVDRLHEGTDTIVRLQDRLLNGAGEYRALP